MSRGDQSELETELRTLFDRQQHAIHPPARDWGQAPVANAVALEPRRSARRHALVGTLAAAAVIGAVLLAAAGHRSATSVQTSGTPKSAGTSPVRWSTPQVRLDAATFSITANGKRFTARHADVDVQTDPGDSDQTLELTWFEHGVQMRWFIYFASNGKKWWATEMRTYDGSPSGDWVKWRGKFFQTPLGHSYSGALDLVGRDHGITSHLKVTGLTLQAFRAP